ncbi:DUF6266 family protein [Pedobacter sp. SYSU D00535]|uniref:DUF6266 family protein n=1 Tax=Pedobacter sp. SYSU D00535 TaxID=2810308 RepID=UPI001A961CB9|nr:DUF6266 family protein [Pedobacter sp. SYSU D00535]
MAKLHPKHLLYGCSGKLGNYVLVTTERGTFARRRPRRTQRVSEMQERTRRSFSFATAFLAQALEVFRLSFASDPRSRYSRAMKLVMKAVCETATALSIDYTRLQLSEGTLKSPALYSVAANSDEVLFKWFWHKRDFAGKDCEAVAVLYFPLTNQWLYQIAPKPLRSLAVRIPKHLREQVAEAFLFFRSKDQQDTSATAYLGSVDIH